MTPSEKSQYSPREFAALATAISWLRNELIRVASPKAEIDLERIGKLIGSTSTAKIEEVLAVPAGSLEVARKKFITPREEHLIAAKDIEHFDEKKNKPPNQAPDPTAPSGRGSA